MVCTFSGWPVASRKRPSAQLPLFLNLLAGDPTPIDTWLLDGLDGWIDPRLAATVGELLLAVVSDLDNPWERRTFRALLRLTVRQGDPRSRRVFDALNGHPSVTTMVKPIIRQHRKELEQQITRSARPLSSGERSLVAALRTPSTEASRALERVHQHPTDLQAKRVYADQLSNLGDVRGEFIQLQCRSALTRTQTQRARTLLRAHRTDWLGVLAPFVDVPAVRWVQGFPQDVRITTVQGLAAFFDHPSWRTIRDLTLADDAWHSAHILDRSALDKLLLHENLNQLRSLRGSLPRSTLQRIWHDQRPEGLRDIELRDVHFVDPYTLEVLRGLPGPPQLESVLLTPSARAALPLQWDEMPVGARVRLVNAPR